MSTPKYKPLINEEQNRLNKVNVLVKEIVAEFLLKEEIISSDNKILSIVITSVRTSPDLKLADIFVVLFNEENYDVESLVAMLNVYAYSIFKYLAKKLRSKFTPKIKFRYDTAYIEQRKVEMLIDNISEKHSEELLANN